MVFRRKIINPAFTRFFILVLFFTFSEQLLAASSEISGLLKVDAQFSEEFDGSSSSNIIINDAEVHFESEISEWIATHISLLYRQHDNPLIEVDLELDNAYIEYGNAFQSSFSAQFGQLYVPFGSFETNMASDPLTLTLAQTREVTFVAAYDSGINAAIYLFNGDLMESGGEDSIDNVGVNLGYIYEGQSTYLDLGVGYINNFGESKYLNNIILLNQSG
ncbi:LbtU family siderophore porin, partial [Kaarinaea lacus]